MNGVPVYLQYYQILLWMQIKNIIRKYFQNNANMQQKRNKINIINEELNLDEFDDESNNDKSNESDKD